jgi:hypothetical protein
MLKSEWWQPVLADFVKVCKIMGITINHEVPYTPGILHRGVHSAWGAFAGKYEAIQIEYKSKINDIGFNIFVREENLYYINAPVIIREHFPDDEELHRIADELCFLNHLYTPMYVAVNRNRDCVGELSMYIASIWFFDPDRNENTSEELKEEIEASFLAVFQDLARWYDKKLKEEYNRLISGEKKEKEHDKE